MKQELIENIDYYIENGKWVFTEKYHLDRGYCCRPNQEKGCRHCPYRSFKKNFESLDGKNQQSA
jgi:hypothetical protein